MSKSHTYTNTFTRTHARHLASKVIADLYQCSLLYDRPSKERISGYEEELVALLANGYVDIYEFGFKHDGKRVLTWRYTVNASGDMDGRDDRSGNLARGVDVADTTYFNFLNHSKAWFALSRSERDAIEVDLPFRRGDGSEPVDGKGSWKTELTYSAGGVLMLRRAFRPW
jgi:hypothetical protein